MHSPISMYHTKNAFNCPWSCDGSNNVQFVPRQSFPSTLFLPCEATCRDMEHECLIMYCASEIMLAGTRQLSAVAHDKTVVAGVPAGTACARFSVAVTTAAAEQGTRTSLGPCSLERLVTTGLACCIRPCGQGWH